MKSTKSCKVDQFFEKPALAGFFPAIKNTGYSRKEWGRPAIEGFKPGFLSTVKT